MQFLQQAGTKTSWPNEKLKIEANLDLLIDLNDHFALVSAVANHSRVFPQILVADWLQPKRRPDRRWGNIDIYGEKFFW